MGVEIVLSYGTPTGQVRALFAARDERFSRFLPSSELNRVNDLPRGATLVSEEFASMLSLSLDAARATSGLVSPAVGGALLAAGHDRDFHLLPRDGDAGGPAAIPSIDSISLRGRLLLRTEDVILDLNGVVKGRTLDDALALVGSGWVSAGGDIATASPIVVGLPAGGSVLLQAGGLATSSVASRRCGDCAHRLIDPATGAPSKSPWRDVTVAASSCLAAGIAAKAALLLGRAGPSWLARRGLAGRFVDHDGAVRANEVWQQIAPSRAAA